MMTVKLQGLLLTAGLLLAFGGVSPAFAQSQASVQSTDDCSIVAALKAEFQKRNPEIADVRVVDVRPSTFGPAKYLVVGRGIRADYDFKGDFSDELFGLFLADGSLRRVERVLDFIPTPRWNDTEVRIARVDADFVALEARGATYGNRLLRRRYRWREGQRKP
jgi:hypothetical protein